MTHRLAPASPQRVVLRYCTLFDCNRQFLLPRHFALLASDPTGAPDGSPPPAGPAKQAPTPPVGNLASRLQSLRSKEAAAERGSSSSAASRESAEEPAKEPARSTRAKKPPVKTSIKPSAKDSAEDTAKRRTKPPKSESAKGKGSGASKQTELTGTGKTMEKIRKAKADFDDLLGRVISNLAASDVGAEGPSEKQYTPRAILKSIDEVLATKTLPKRQRERSKSMLMAQVARELRGRVLKTGSGVPYEQADYAKLSEYANAKLEGLSMRDKLTALSSANFWESGWGSDKLVRPGTDDAVRDPQAPAEGAGVATGGNPAPRVRRVPGLKLRANVLSLQRLLFPDTEDVVRDPQAPAEEAGVATGGDPTPRVKRVFGLKPPEAIPNLDHKSQGELRPEGVPLEKVEPPYEAAIPTLAHGLDRVLFNPTVHWLQDPHSRVYNFEPYLQKITQPDDFAYDRLMSFVPAAKDQDLWDLAESHDLKYIGSTSGLTGILSHIYWLISRWRPVDTRMLSADFAREPRSFAFGNRVPVSIKLRYKDGRYAVDPDKSFETVGKANSILMYLGTLMEKLLTLEPDKFGKLLKAAPEEPGLFFKREAYYYSKTSKMLMRSQLDCYDPRLPGTGTFDLKTRGVIPIRRDRLNYVENSGYLIKYSQGLFESFEREYYDMMRSAFLKYSFQVRIGNMDGIFVAYHNTAQIFGFQYISLEEMDTRLCGSTEMADDAFRLCLAVLETILDEATSAFPRQTLRMTFETPEDHQVMKAWVEPDEWDEDVQGPRPIVQLDLRTESTLNGKLTLHPIDYESARRGSDPVKWSLKYKITRTARNTSAMATANAALELARARQREVQRMYLPSGVGKEEMLAKFDTMDVADIIRSRQTPSDADSEHEHAIAASSDAADGGQTEIDSEDKKKLVFGNPPGTIIELRKMAREGAKDSKRMAALESEKDKVVWRPSPQSTPQQPGKPNVESEKGTPAPWWKVW